MAKKKTTAKKAAAKKTLKKKAVKKKTAKKKQAGKKKTAAKTKTKSAASKKKATRKKAAPKKKVAVKKKAVKKTKAVKKKAAKKQVAKKTKVAAKKKSAVTKTPAKKSASGFVAKVDAACPIASKVKVYEEFDAMLNQTNIGANNNKFYVIQLLQKGKQFYCWTRWGRVGENGQNALIGPGSLENATKEFEKKFKSKTSNKWSDRANFVAKSGKYTLIEIDRSADAKRSAEVESKLKALDGSAKKSSPKVKPSKLAKPLQSFVQLIFSKDMFRSAMADLEIDVNKMPLGQLSEAQVKKGFGVLEDIEEQLEKSRKNNRKLADLSSKFYTVVPHSFGRRIPPVIGDQTMLQKKMDMLNVLSDIEVALAAESKAQNTKSVDNPLDRNYSSLNADLTPLKTSSKEFKVIQKYLKATKGGKAELIDVFELDRNGADKRFAAHDKLENRKLLWHGTNVAVVAAILKSGLRIMPHSGGRVGKGIYMASEQAKSAWYVGRARGIGIMFLCEAALGKEHSITRDNWRLKAAPKGYDSIVARGRVEPDPKSDATIQLGGKKVTVPQGKPIKQKQYAKSSFSQSEYLVYKESQVRLRYVLKLKM